MTLEERISYVRDNYPETMTQRQFAEAAGICISIAYRLNRDGVVPYVEERDGFEHHYKINRSDVIRYLEHKHAHASVLYTDAGHKCISMILWDEPDALTVKDIMRITGTVKSSVTKWIATGKLRGYSYIKYTIVLKRDLIDFMASPIYLDSSHRNIRAKAIALSISWYKDIVERYEKGGVEAWAR